MSYKRSRSTFEADTHAPYALFGSPLPDENDARDHGAYLPLWKQDVRDDKGRRRLHGAFTGGWSAGYFNTVGSKEGWTPSAFVSSRNNRRKDDAAPSTIQQRAEEYMDDEDLADAAEAQTLHTSGAFAGLGLSTQEEVRAGGILGLFRPSGDTKGLQLLRRMGWKDGQGIGPKVRRSARLGVSTGASVPDDQLQLHLFAPDDAPTVDFVRKTDKMGLGYKAGARLGDPDKDRGSPEQEHSEGEDHPLRKAGGFSLLGPARKKAAPARGAFGVGVLNDTGSDDEDPYEMGPKIRYNRTLGGPKTQKQKQKKKNKAVAPANPAFQNAPVFVSKTARAGLGLGRCHDGRLPLDGFVLGKAVEEDWNALIAKHAPPTVPDGWKSSRDHPSSGAAAARHTSTADAARAAAPLDSRSRAALLGEKQLPGKSVFDFISPSARDKLAAASGNASLPPGLGEAPRGHAPSSEDERGRALWQQVPRLDQPTAAAALSRSEGGPYADDEAKRGRYRKYLISQANPGQPLPDKAAGAADGDYVREMNEFYDCARIFKPMTGFMASRFTTSKSVLNPPSAGDGGGDGGAPTADPLARPASKAADPAEEAARMGMFGAMTRSVDDFYPTRLLCKRFNVRPPPQHPRPDHDAAAEAPSNNQRPAPWPAAENAARALPPAPPHCEQAVSSRSAPQPPPPADVDPDKNDALEGHAANAELLKAIFGDSDDGE